MTPNRKALGRAALLVARNILPHEQRRWERNQATAHMHGAANRVRRLGDVGALLDLLSALVEDHAARGYYHPGEYRALVAVEKLTTLLVLPEVHPDDLRRMLCLVLGASQYTTDRPTFRTASSGARPSP